MREESESRMAQGSTGGGGKADRRARAARGEVEKVKGSANRESGSRGGHRQAKRPEGKMGTTPSCTGEASENVTPRKTLQDQVTQRQRGGTAQRKAKGRLEATRKGKRRQAKGHGEQRKGSSKADGRKRKA